MAKNQLIYGFHGIQAVIRHRPQDIVRIFYDRQRAVRNDPRMQHFMNEVMALDIHVSPVDGLRLDQMPQGGPHQGVIAEVKDRPALSLKAFLEQITQEKSAPVLMLLDSVTDPHNFGACFRVADAFGVSAIIAPKDRSAGLNATVVKSASGATETVPFFPVTNLVRAIELIKEKGFWVYGTDSEEVGTPIEQNDLTGPVAWIFGSEGKGMRSLTRQHCDHLVTIPMIGSVESLNISVAAGICLYETQRQRRG